MAAQKRFLPFVNGPDDLKTLSTKDLDCLADEIRAEIVETVSHNGGHLASNLGVVELAVALHMVFHTPDDSIVWDVGHQCYAHKLLTGRRDAFPALRRAGGLAGFPKTSESPHDSFNTGHASTSISAALGILAAERLSGGKNRACAVIGDGALTGGLAYEALSHAGQLGLPLVVVLNDNKMSIGPNVGGLSKYLSRLSMKAKYQSFRQGFDSIVKAIPLLGGGLFNLVLRLKRAVKAVFYTDNFFVDLGFEYVGPIDGHSIPQLVSVIRDAKNLEKPVVIHVITRKGKGYRFAESDPGSYHGVQAFSAEEGLAPAADQSNGGLTFTKAFGEAMLAAGARDKRLAAVCAAMEQGTGLSAFKQAYPARFFDAGIAEEHAVTFAAGLAAKGMRPVVAMYSTFLQRAADQVIHDVCLQKLPVIFAADRAGFVSDDGETHQGLFDISLFRSAPHLTILAPADAAELAMMLDFALNRGGPVLIRYPKAACGEGSGNTAPLLEGRGVFIRGGPSAESGAAGGKNALIAFTGSLCREASAAADLLEKEGIAASLYNLRFIKPLDEDYLAAVMAGFSLALFAEEGSKAGGVGEAAAELAERRRLPCRVLAVGAGENFVSLGKRDELLAANGLDGPGIAGEVIRALS